MQPANFITTGRISIFACSGIAALALGLSGEPPALTVSTSILGVLVGLHLLLDYGWIRLVATPAAAAAPAAPTTPATTGVAAADWGPPFKDGANLVITVDGVVLGLVFAFVAKGTSDTALVDVGAASLAAGVLFGILLYSLAAGGIAKDWGAAIASIMLNLSLYALAYGLICIVAALITAPTS